MQNFANSQELICLIERILIIGVTEDDISIKFNLIKENTNPYELETKTKVLEDYKSNYYNDSNQDNYADNLDFCFPEGLKIRSDGKNNGSTYHSFCLTTRMNVRLHCYCLTFYEQYEITNIKYYIPKALCLISKLPLYTMLKDILKNIYTIMTNYKANRKLFPEKLNYVFVKEKSKSYTVIKEYNLLDFYFGFLLNSIRLKKGDKSFASYYMSNNSGKKYFFKFHLNDKTSIGVPDFDMTILLDKFNVEDLIKIYTALLMEYKVFLVFDNYEDINIIIWSLISILFPMKWNLPIIPFIAKKLNTDFLETIVPTIAGCPSSLIPLINEKLSKNLITDDTVIYNISNKTFIHLPKLGELAPKILDNLKSNLYYILSEKFKFSTNDYAETELCKIFSLEIVEKINYNIYLNLKIIQAFFTTYLELMKNIDNSLNIGLVSSFISSASTTITIKKERVCASKYFDKEKFIYNRDYCDEKLYIYLIDSFIKTQLFMAFLEDYIVSKDKTKILKTFITIINSGEKSSKSIFKEVLKEQIQNTILGYYEVKSCLIKFNYISMEQALRCYIEKYGSIKSRAVNEKLLWNGLDKTKVNRFNFPYEKLMMNDNDERIKDDFYIKINRELSKYKDQKSFEIQDDDHDLIKLNKEYNKRLKTHIDEYFSNSQHNSMHNSSLNKNRSIDVNSLDCSNLNISRNNNSQHNVAGDITPKKIKNLRATNLLLNGINMSSMSNDPFEKSFHTVNSNKKTLANLYFSDFKKQFSIGDLTSRNTLNQKHINLIKEMKNHNASQYSNQRNSLDISHFNKNPGNLIAQLQSTHNHLSSFSKNHNRQSNHLNSSNLHNISINESSEYFKRMSTTKNLDNTQRSRDISILRNCESLQKLMGDDDLIVLDDCAKKVSPTF